MTTPSLSSEEIVQAAQLCHAVYQDEPDVSGWTPLALDDLDVPEGYQPDGRYVNKNSLAFVSTTEINGKTTLALTFKGTDKLCHRDWTDNVVNINGHYDKLRPLVDAVDRYAKSKGIERVIVMGHSLGGVMASIYLQEHDSETTEENGIEYHGVSFGSPGGKFCETAYDGRLTAIRHANDVVPKVAAARARLGRTGYRTPGRVVEVMEEGTGRFDGMLGGVKAHGMLEYIKTVNELSRDNTLDRVMASTEEVTIARRLSPDDADVIDTRIIGQDPEPTSEPPEATVAPAGMTM